MQKEDQLCCDQEASPIGDLGQYSNEFEKLDNVGSWERLGPCKYGASTHSLGNSDDFPPLGQPVHTLQPSVTKHHMLAIVSPHGCIDRFFHPKRECRCAPLQVQRYRERVVQARENLRERFGKKSKARCNARMSPKQINAHCQLDEAGEWMMQMTLTELNFSARAYDRILKVSRTIADLAGSEQV